MKLRKNFRAVFCGHDGTANYTAHKIDTGVYGNQVNQILNDFQNAANFGDGWIGLVTFHPSAGTVDVSYYWTWAPSGLGESTNYPTYSVSWLPVVHTNSLRLVATLAPGPARKLTLCGDPGKTYYLEYKTNLTATLTWQFLAQVAQTNYCQDISNVGVNVPVIFYRAYEQIP